MYDDANLPHDEAWESVTKDLCQTKESRNALSKENSYVSPFSVPVCVPRAEQGAETENRRTGLRKRGVSLLLVPC